MAKQVKIKDIAIMAGVSAGTVDRILHNRGRVSPQSKEAVEKVLAEVGYKHNIHTSAISLKKTYRLGISIPSFTSGEYWNSIYEGIEAALEEYHDVGMECNTFFYDQFDAESCQKAYSNLLDFCPDAAIIGPTFTASAQTLCNDLDEAGIPYVFLDTIVPDTNPVETFTTDQHTGGYLLAKLLDMSIPTGSEMAVFSFTRTGGEESKNTLQRSNGFKEYIHNSGKVCYPQAGKLPIADMATSESILINFIKNHPDVKGVAVLNSRGHILAQMLKSNGRQDIKVVSFDLTEENVRHLNEGGISALICQNPKTQGFNSVQSIINKLLYNKKVDRPHHMVPIDVVFKENLPYMESR